MQTRLPLLWVVRDAGGPAKDVDGPRVCDTAGCSVDVYGEQVLAGAEKRESGTDVEDMYAVAVNGYGDEGVCIAGRG